MAAEITQIDTQDFTSQTYGEQDVNLISTFDVTTFDDRILRINNIDADSLHLNK